MQVDLSFKRWLKNTDSISGSVVPLAMFWCTCDMGWQNWISGQYSRVIILLYLMVHANPLSFLALKNNQGHVWAEAGNPDMMSHCIRVLTIWLSDYLTIWPSDYLTIWLSDYLTIWLSDYLTIWQNLETSQRWSRPRSEATRSWSSW